MTTETISTTISTQVTPDSGNYGPSLTIENSGAVFVPIQGDVKLQKAIYIPASGAQDNIVNFGKIESLTNFETDGAVAIWSAAAATISNFGFVDGSYIGALMVRGGNFTNFGTVYSPGFGALLLNGGSINNLGIILSTTFGSTLHDASMSNTGTISSEDVGVSLYNQSELINSGTIIAGSSAVSIAASGQLTDSGLISGGNYAVIGSGPITLKLDSLAVLRGRVDDVSDEGTMFLEGELHGNLKMDGSFTGFDEYMFLNDSTWTLEGNLNELASKETISGFTIGDTIILDGFVPQSETYIPGIGIVLDGDGLTETIKITGDLTTSEYVVLGSNDNTYIIAPCFRSGTKITTISGKVPIDHLQTGDIIKSLHQQWSRIKWIGRRSYDGRFISKNDFILPICIKRGALDEDIPSNDLFLSPDHAVCADGMLINAWRLLNGTSITQIPKVDELIYFHIELDHHDIIYAEDCPTESFLDTNCRRRFENSEDYYKLYPSSIFSTEPCLPRLSDGIQLFLIQSRIKARAGLGVFQDKIGALRGCVDEAGPSVVRGWAQDIDSPEYPVLLSICCFGESKLVVMANQYRPDLRVAGLGSGCHGFECFLDSEVPSENIEVRRIPDGALIKSSDNRLVSKLTA